MKMQVIMPTVNLVPCPLYFFYFIMYKAVFYIMHIQVINNNGSRRFKAAGNGSHGIIMFAPGTKIAK
jgi:hypothetical protein